MHDTQNVRWGEGQGNLPVQPRNPTESLNVVVQLVHHFVLCRVRDSPVASVTLDVLAKEGPSNRFGGHLAVVAVISGPFGKVVCKIKGCRRRIGIFVVNEMDFLDFVGLGLGLGRPCCRANDHIGTQQVAVGKDQLGRV